MIDTNVMVAALISPSGTNREVLRRCLLGRYEPLVGAALFCEMRDTMSRTELFERCPVSNEDRQTLFTSFLAVCRWTYIYYLWRPNLPDEGDNHVIELAVAGGAELIVTNNVRDFRAGELRFPQIRICSPRDLLMEDK